MTSRDARIQELTDRLNQSETLNGELQTSANMRSKQADTQIYQLEKKVAEKEEQCEKWQSECKEICTKILTLSYSLCDLCSNHSIEPTLCDQVLRLASHL